ncbi:MAG: 3,4-dihydroxy 2-butanone 4-phosphate synthase / cyclohydrolase, partial [Verrucomicrobiota bacterium]
RWGMFRALGFERDIVNGVHQIDTALALVLGDVTTGVPLVRIHSQCVTGEMLGSMRCDCGDQLEMAMQAIAEEGRGLLIYEYQEGRGIGLSAKLQAYALQDGGLDTVEANRALGFAADCRDFSLPAAILHDLGLSRIRLLSNNPSKTRALVDSGIEVVAQVPCEATPTLHSLAYLRTKKEKMGHALRLGPQENTEHDEDFEFASIEEAIGELQAGRMIVVVDDEDRENEGDLTMAAEMITPEAVNFMAMHGRGLICLAMTGERLDELDLAPMSPDNTALGGTAFTVSIDVKGADVTTGISARDRAQTILAVTDASTCSDDFARPGHVFPLRARDGGVLERRGQTEAAVDLASLAGLSPAGVICEIVNDDGTMARVPDLIRFCKKHKLVMITVSELARYRMDFDDGAMLEVLEGFMPVLPKFSAQGARRFELGDLIPSPALTNSEMSGFENLRKR